MATAPDKIWSEENLHGVIIPAYRKDNVWAGDQSSIDFTPKLALTEQDIALLDRVAVKRKGRGIWTTFCQARKAIRDAAQPST